VDKDLESIQLTRELIAKAKTAQQKLERYTQDQVDHIVGLLAQHGYRAAQQLAELAYQETGMGRVESKLEKNIFATRTLYYHIKDIQTVGILTQDLHHQIYEVATPMGIVAGIIPVTNPTSTSLFKIISALKARCCIILSPHPKAKNCIQKTVNIMQNALQSIGEPEEFIGCLPIPTMEATHTLMQHPDIAVILATGGGGLVKAAYSSGKPAIGVGPGNCPAYIEASADIPHAIRCLIISQSFDWGTICASEQSVIIENSILEQCLQEFQRQEGHICTPEEIKKLEDLMPNDGSIPPALVGKSPFHIAKIAGFTVPETTKVLIAQQTGVGNEYPLSREKLSPILAMYIVKNPDEAYQLCHQLLVYGGIGHSVAIHSKNQKIIQNFALQNKASRILVNVPSSQGGVGYATTLSPSLTLGCGSPGGNITSDNITCKHLLNIKRIAFAHNDFFPDVPAPKINMFNISKQEKKYRRDPFEDLPTPNRAFYVGPHNNVK